MNITDRYSLLFTLNDEVNKDSHTETMEKRKSEIISLGLFNNVDVFEYPWEDKLDVGDYIKSLNSFSKFVCLDDEIKTKLNKGIEKIINN